MVTQVAVTIGYQGTHTCFVSNTEFVFIFTLNLNLDQICSVSIDLDATTRRNDDVLLRGCQEEYFKKQQ